jgi:hypothetical protein
MKRRIKKSSWGIFPLLLLLILGGCFSIPFIGKDKVDRSKIEPQESDFSRNSVFVGYDKNDAPIVEMRLVNQEVIPEKGLIVHTRLFPTENFKVRNIFRGLRSINYYPIERRFHRLELKIGRRNIKMKVLENLQVKDTKPVEADFEHTGIFRLLPDTINTARLKFQDVKRWGKMPEDTLDAWYAAKEDYIRQVQQAEQRSSLVDRYRRRQKKDDKKSFAQYDSVFVTTNNTYVYLEKEVDSNILFTVNAGDYFPYGVSDGDWVEVPISDSLQVSLQEFLDARYEKAVKQLEQQRRLERSRRGPARGPQVEVDTTREATGFILDVMVQKSYSKALDWEMESMVEPVDVPLFAKVLRDREAARVARLDSIEQARLDSIARIKQVADSTAAADSARADSVSAPAVSQDTTKTGQKSSQGVNEPSKPPQADTRAGQKMGGPGQKKPTGEQLEKPANVPGESPQAATAVDQAPGGKNRKEANDSQGKNPAQPSGRDSKTGNP